MTKDQRNAEQELELRELYFLRDSLRDMHHDVRARIAELQEEKAKQEGILAFLAGQQQIVKTKIDGCGRPTGEES